MTEAGVLTRRPYHGAPSGLVVASYVRVEHKPYYMQSEAE